MGLLVGSIVSYTDARREAWCLEPSQTEPHASLLMRILLLSYNANCNYSAFLSSMSLSRELMNPKGVHGDLQFVAGWSEVKVALGTSKLVAGV